MSWLIDGRGRDGWLITATADPPKTVLDEIRAALGIRLAHHFGGNSLTDVIGGVALATVNGPSFDTTVSDTLDGTPLASDPPSLTWSHAYQTTITNQSFDAPLPSSVPVGADSVMVALMGRDPSAAPGVCSWVGNRDTGDEDGFEIVYDKTTGEMRATAQVVGETAVSAEIAAVMDDNFWRPIVMIADRANGILRLSDFETEMSVALPAGTLASAAPFSLFQVGGKLACTAQMMFCMVAFGEQVEGRSAQPIAQALAKLVSVTDQFSFVSTPLK